MNCTLSPGLSLVSWSLSRTVKTMVMPGMSRLLMSPCLRVTLPLSGSIFLTSPSVIESDAGAATWLGLGLVWA